MFNYYRLRTFCVHWRLEESRLFIGLFYFIISLFEAPCGELLIHDNTFEHRHSFLGLFVHYGFVITLIINGITNLLEYCNDHKNGICLIINMGILAAGITTYLCILVTILYLLFDDCNWFLFGLLLLVSPTIVFSLYSTCILYSYYCDLQEESNILYRKKRRRPPLNKIRIHDDEIELCYTTPQFM